MAYTDREPFRMDVAAGKTGNRLWGRGVGHRTGRLAAAPERDNEGAVKNFILGRKYGGRARRGREAFRQLTEKGCKATRRTCSTLDGSREASAGQQDQTTAGNSWGRGLRDGRARPLLPTIGQVCMAVEPPDRRTFPQA